MQINLMDHGLHYGTNARCSSIEYVCTGHGNRACSIRRFLTPLAEETIKSKGTTLLN